MILAVLGALYAAVIALMVILARAAGRSDRRAAAMRAAHGIPPAPVLDPSPKPIEGGFLQSPPSPAPPPAKTRIAT